MSKIPVVFSWSGGKDSALALHVLQQDARYQVVSLFTTVNMDTGTSSMHGIPLEVLQRQAACLQLPLHIVTLRKEPDAYAQQMLATAHHFQAQGVTHFAFGDIYLSEVREYREQQLNPLGITVLEPIWGQTSEQIMERFLKSGIKTTIVITHAPDLGPEFVGRDIDQDLVAQLPAGIDICGENGEYHTLAYAGGPFKEELAFKLGSTTQTTHDFKMDTGEMKTFTYWRAEIS